MENQRTKKKVCGTCGNEGVAWLLSPCPDCDEGRKVKKIGDRVTKSLITKKIKRIKGYRLKERKRVTKELNRFIKSNNYNLKQEARHSSQA